MPDNLRDSLTRSRHVRELAEALRRLFRQQAMDVASRVTLDGPVPELVGWVEPIAEAAMPMLLRLTQNGIVETQLRLARRGERSGTIQSDGLRRYAVPTGEAFGETAKGVMWNARSAQSVLRLQRMLEKAGGSSGYVTKAAAPDARIAFDLFNPQVIDAVDEAAFRFCRETMETARSDLADSLAKLRRALRGGLQRGDALRKLAEDVHRIFADPARAYRIAVTEASRAQHAGQLMAAKESGVVKKKSWLASSDACDLCLGIMEKGPVELHLPFWVDSKGGPYATVHAPPAHPHCLLPETPVMAPGTVCAMKAFFTGTCFRITFANGDEFACTPNHMLLTRFGMLTASQIVEGDDVVYCPLRKRLASDYPDDHWEPTRIDEMFNSLAVSRSMTACSVPVSSEYLHGDAALCDGNVHVIKTDGFLRDRSRIRPGSEEPVAELPFEDSHLPFSFDGSGKQQFGILLHRLAPLCGLSWSRHSRAVFLGHNRVRFGMRHMRDTMPSQYFEDGPATAAVLDRKAVSGSRHIVAERVVTDTKVGIDAFLLRGEVELSRCTHVEPFRYRGWVYDLQTTSTLYYISGGIIGSNCFCSMNEEIE